MENFILKIALIPFRLLYIYRDLVWSNYYLKQNLIFTNEEVKFRFKKLYPLQEFLLKFKVIKK